MIRNTNDDDDDPDDCDRRKTSSQTMKRYRLGFQQRRDVDVDVDDGTSSNNPIIALPVGKIIGRNPKNPIDAQKHISELGTILSFKKKSDGSCSNIPRKLFGITSNTSSCVTLKVIFVKGKPPTNIHKLVKYCSKPKNNNNNNNNAKRQQEKRLVEHRFTSDTKELVLKPNDILKIQDHTFHIVPCPDTPEDDEEEDQENDEAEEEMKPSSSLSSSSSKTSTAFSGANKNTNLSSLPKSNSKSNTIMRGWTPPTTTIPSFSVGSVGDSTIEMDSIASSTTLLSSSVSSSSSTKKRKSPTIQKVSRTTITTTAPQKKKKIMNNNDDARMMIPSPSEPEPKKVKKTSTTIISTKANIGKDDEEVISSDDDDEVISLPTQKMKKFTSAAVTAAATKNNSIINNKIKSNDDINKKKNDVTIGSKNTKKRDNPSPFEDTTNATTKKNDNNNNKTQRRSEEEDIVKVKGESHDTTTASTTTTSLRRSTRSRRAPIELYKTDTVRRYDNNDESSVASSSCCISTTTSTTTTTTKKKKKMKQQQQQKQPSLPPKSLISSSSSSNTNKTVSKAKADKIMNQHVKKIEETREQKEQILKDGDIVLAEYHVDKSYYWGKIISTQHIPRKGVRYHVRFQDGDESPSVAADCLSRGILYVELIKNGWWAENLPPKEYLDELELFSSNAKQKERDGDDIYIAKKKTNHVNEEEEEEEEPDENKSSIAPSIRRSKRARAPAIREEEEEEEEMAMTKTASNQKVAAASVLAKSKMSNQKKDVPIRFDFPTSNFIPPMDKEGQILLPPGVEPFVPTMSFFHMIPEEKLSNNNDPAVAAKRQQNEPQEEAEDTERILKKIPASLSSSPLKGATAAAARTTDDDEDDDEDHDIDGMAEEDDDDDDERGPRDMHVSLAKVYWKALNSPQPHLGSQFFQMLLSQNRLPETRLCNDLVQLLTKGPELGDYAFYDGHRLNLAFEYVEKVVEKFPSIMMPRFAEAAGGEYWKSSLDYLTTLPYGNNDVSTALNLHNFNLKLLNLLLRGLLLLDDGSHSLPLLRDMRAYGLSAVCRYCCQTMASVWTKYGHYIWEHGDGEDDLVCPLTVELTNRLSDIVVQLMDHFKIPMNDRVEMLWDSMNVQIQAAPSERREDENWVRQLKMYWIPSLLMIEHEASPQHWEDLCIKLARCADVEELVTMMGMGIR